MQAVRADYDARPFLELSVSRPAPDPVYAAVILDQAAYREPLAKLSSRLDGGVDQDLVENDPPGAERIG